MMKGVTRPVFEKIVYYAAVLFFSVRLLCAETAQNTSIVKPDLNPEFLEKRYAPFKGEANYRLYFIVHNLGLNETQTREIISLLPKEVAISLSPYATYSKNFLDMLKKKGHHVLWIQPTEFYRHPTLVEDPLRLSRFKTPEQNAVSIDAVLEKMPSIVTGIITDEATPVVHDKHVMDVLLPKLQKKKLPFVHSEMSPDHDFIGLCKNHQVHCSEPDYHIHRAMPPMDIGRTLRHAKVLAEQTGYVFVSIEADKNNVLAFLNWYKDLDGQQYMLKPYAVQDLIS